MTVAFCHSDREVFFFDEESRCHSDREVFFFDEDSSCHSDREVFYFDEESRCYSDREVFFFDEDSFTFFVLLKIIQMKHILSPALLLLIFNIQLSAQSFRGRIIEANTQNGIPYVNVQLDNRYGVYYNKFKHIG
jgi:hypothetical protein